MTLRSTLLTLVTAGLVLAPTAAHAQAYGHDDAANDVVSIDVDDSGMRRIAPAPAPERALGDITRLVVRHADQRLKLSIAYQEYRPGVLSTGVELRTSGRRAYAIYSFDDQAFLIDYTSDEEFVRCKVRSVYNARYERHEMSIPRWCIGRPTWVRAGAATFSARYNVDTGIPEEAFLDDAWLDGTVARDFEITVGAPRLLRGVTLAQ